jgi:hypothetical protein
LYLGLTDTGLFVKGEGFKSPVPGDPGPFEPIEEALVLAVGLLLDQETMKDFRDRGGLLFCSLEFAIEGACHPFEA